MSTNQKTIEKEIFLEGIGVHTGVRATVLLKPCEPNTGITIVNKQIPDKPIKIGTCIPEPTMHATVLKGAGWAISTIEHLFAALSSFGIDNILIEVEGPEIPILDGSALPFVQIIKNTGIIEQSEPKKYITPKKTIKFKQDNRFLEITPTYDGAKNLTFDYTIEFEHPLVQGSQLSGTVSEDFFAREVAPARTFGFLEQLPFLRKHGLAKGTTLGNTVVVGDDIFLNNLRFPDEFIRHKILDLIGDLALLGKNLIGNVKAHKTGHNFNRKVVEHFIKNPNQWIEV